MKKTKTLGYTIRIPECTYKTLLTYRAQFRPHMSINALIVEAIIEQVKGIAPPKAAP